MKRFLRFTIYAIGLAIVLLVVARRERTQEGVHRERGPPLTRQAAGAMRHAEALSFEIRSHDHAEQQLRGVVRIVMPEP